LSDQPEKHEKTEDPTQKKLDDARNKGDLPRSTEVTTWFVLAGATLIAALWSGGMASDLSARLARFLGQAHAMPLDAGGLRLMWRDILLILISAAIVPMAVLALGGIIGNLVQNAPGISSESLKPKFSKISLLAGAKRVFGPQSLVNFVKSIAKLVVVSAALVLVLWPQRDRLDIVMAMEPGALLALMRESSVQLLLVVLAVLALIAGADYLYQRHSWMQRQRMTLKEVRDEMKQTEGDPLIKAKIRQVRMERSRKRMMAAVPQATVVVTNPTHFAVALLYTREMPAPKCVAKGVDAVALRIRALAAEHEVPVIENPPLARSLYASVDLDDEIPEEHYKAVAQIIGYVMQLKSKRSWRGAGR
jgi:flagellar biosynthetic protein FlhB